MNRFFFILLLFLISCEDNNYLKDFKTRFDRNSGKLTASFSLNISIPDNMEKNLKMFSVSSILISAVIYDSDKKIISRNSIQRIVRYDRWNDVFSVKDSYALYTLSYHDYKSMEKSLMAFENVPFVINDEGAVKNFMIIDYDVNVRSVEFPEPFKFIEYYVKSDNIRISNTKYKFYAENY
jgi:hypothetical protein